jgi:hypothetical protein
LFFPLLLLEAVQPHVSSVQAIAGRVLRHQVGDVAAVRRR